MGIGTKIGAVSGAVAAAGGGVVVPLANKYENPASTPDSAIYQETDYCPGVGLDLDNPSLTYHAPTEDAQPSTVQKVGKLGKTIEDGIGSVSDATKAKTDAEETGDLNNALQGPEYADNNDVPSSIQESVPSKDTTQSGPNNDGGDYDYYSGIM